MKKVVIRIRIKKHTKGGNTKADRRSKFTDTVPNLRVMGEAIRLIATEALVPCFRTSGRGEAFLRRATEVVGNDLFDSLNMTKWCIRRNTIGANNQRIWRKNY